MNRGSREDGSNGRRREITLHSFRRFVKTTISDLGYSDFSEYFIGHSGSTYWRKKESEKAELFKKVEPYLTFLNIHQLERQGADIQTKVEELEELNQSLSPTGHPFITTNRDGIPPNNLDLLPSCYQDDR